jgi:hypothetical protein
VGGGGEGAEGLRQHLQAHARTRTRTSGRGGLDHELSELQGSRLHVCARGCVWVVIFEGGLQ